MAVTGWKFPGTITSDGTGNQAWSNPGNAGADDTSWAVTGNMTSGQTSADLECENFGFTTGDVPSGSTIDGIEVEYERQTTGLAASQVTCLKVQLALAATDKGSDQKDAAQWAKSPSTDTITVGGASNKWGWTDVDDSDIRDSTFTVNIACQHNGGVFAVGNINYVKARVYYTPVVDVTPPAGTATITGYAPTVLATAAEQEGYRWRDDDGSESGASWHAAQDTDITKPKGQNVRLRMLTDTTGNRGSEQAKLQYRKVGDAEWRDVPT